MPANFFLWEMAATFELIPYFYFIVKLFYGLAILNLIWFLISISLLTAN